ncbi:hypothetical protein CQW23_17005 [Capsicum baccatum]|uniref:alanine--tRNA ligase n=1 Tax=Capsicum baccatum TaxID=33114 RepID=A0A2G2WCY7_CAPBA|nr:hypothetical protein CQW23_17005 [Capsicum baccatum]
MLEQHEEVELGEIELEISSSKTSGVTGPSGPCSELYYDFHPERGTSNVDLGDDTRFIEFYNLVFMQYNKKDDVSLELLKQKNIDTILSLERVATILQKIIGDHMNVVVYLISDGVNPSNIRKGYVVHHTASHLLQSALKRVIGQEISQAGSMVAFDHLRFDFKFHRPFLDKELIEIEGLINQWIGDGIILETKVMSLTDAKGVGAIAMF